MKSKIGLLAIVLTSGLLLSACTAQNSDQSKNTNSNEQQVQEQNGNQPSSNPQGRSQGEQPMDLAVAAETLGVSEEDLRTALGMKEMIDDVRPSGEPKQMDLAAAAETLGVTEIELKEALGWDGNMPSGAPQQGDMNQNGQK